MPGSKWVIAGVAAAGLSFLAARPATNSFVVQTAIRRPARAVYDMHVDPVRFYAVLNHSEDTLNNDYRVVDVRHTSASALEYDLLHVTRYKDIRSTPRRFDIDPATLTFSEEFKVLGTTFTFQWKFAPADPAAAGADTRVTLNITTQGPYIFCLLFRRVKTDFERRFRITKEHLDELIPE